MKKYNGQYLDTVKTQNFTSPVLLKSRPISATFVKTPIIRSLKWLMTARHNLIFVIVGICWYSEIKDDKGWGEMERYASW